MKKTLFILLNIIFFSRILFSQTTTVQSTGGYVITGGGGGGTGTVQSVTVTPANGISGTVANPTINPAITLSVTTVSGNLISAGTGTLAITGNSSISGTHSGTSSGTNTGDQTITLTGDVTGTGTGSFATAIGAGKVTNSMLAGSIDLTNKVTGILPLANGGTNSNLTASNGGIFYSNSSGGAILAGTANANKILLSGSSTTPSWSISTIPSSAGATANKILLSDGTNYVLSTPTFPNTSATSGKWITSDGTNWIASTPTLSSTATSAKYLRGDGTNWITSTLSLPNASTANYIAYSTSSNTIGENSNLQFDGTNFGIGGAGSSRLHVMTSNATVCLFDGASSSTSIGSGVYGTLANTNSTTGNMALWGFSDASNGSYSASLECKFVNRTSHYGDMGLATRSSDGYFYRLYILNSGSVGIGNNVTSPTAQLHVVSSGSTSATYAIKVNKSDNDTLFHVRNDGAIMFGSNGTNVTAGDAATINEPSGSFIKDNSGTTFTLTNSLITAKSKIFLQVVTTGLTAGNEVIPVVGAGSCTINFQTSLLGAAAPSANSTVNFWVINY